VFVLASLALFTHALRTEATFVLAGSPEVILQRMVAGRHDLIPPGYLDKIGRIRGVQKKEGRLWGYYYDPVVNANYTFMARPAEEVAGGTIMVGAALALGRGLAAGNVISFRSYSGKLLCLQGRRVLSQDSELVGRSGADLGKPISAPSSTIRPDITPTSRCRSPTRWKCATSPPSWPPPCPTRGPSCARKCCAPIRAFSTGAKASFSPLLSAPFSPSSFWPGRRPPAFRPRKSAKSASSRPSAGKPATSSSMKLWEGLLISLTAFLLGFVAAYVHVFHFGAPLFEPVFKGWAVLYPRFQLVPADRWPAGRDAVLFHGLSLHGGGAGADLASRDHRPRCGDAMIELIEQYQARPSTRASPMNTGRSNGIDLTLEAGKVTAFRGPSGSGKTTLLTLVGCLARPTSGRVRLSR
jgi:hypothetical protein